MTGGPGVIQSCSLMPAVAALVCAEGLRANLRPPRCRRQVGQTGRKDRRTHGTDCSLPGRGAAPQGMHWSPAGPAASPNWESHCGEGWPLPYTHLHGSEPPPLPVGMAMVSCAPRDVCHLLPPKKTPVGAVGAPSPKVWPRWPSLGAEVPPQPPAHMEVTVRPPSRDPVSPGAPAPSHKSRSQADYDFSSLGRAWGWVCPLCYPGTGGALAASLWEPRGCCAW